MIRDVKKDQNPLQDHSYLILIFFSINLLHPSSLFLINTFWKPHYLTCLCIRKLVRFILSVGVCKLILLLGIGFILLLLLSFYLNLLVGVKSDNHILQGTQMAR